MTVEAQLAIWQIREADRAVPLDGLLLLPSRALQRKRFDFGL
jgi:hypothetical protein